MNANHICISINLILRSSISIGKSFFSFEVLIWKLHLTYTGNWRFKLISSWKKSVYKNITIVNDFFYYHSTRFFFLIRCLCSHILLSLKYYWMIWSEHNYVFVDALFWIKVHYFAYIKMQFKKLLIHMINFISKPSALFLAWWTTWELQVTHWKNCIFIA